jgi:hypothetical protein
MRTHPMMTTSGTGGYLLTGIRVVPSDSPDHIGGGNRQDSKRSRQKKVRI